MRKPRTREAMIEYLSSHFRYDTMNSWNQSTSYAKKIKLYSLGLTREQENACGEMMDVEGSYDASGYNAILEEFGNRYHHSYQIWTNGRSGGYLVLGQGGERPSEHKSQCRRCGQRNFQAVEQPVAPKQGDPGQPGRCGNCGEQARYNRTFPPDVYLQPGLSLDQNEDFTEWSTDDLRNRVDLVLDFDKTCDSAVKAFVKYAMSHQVKEKTVYVAKKIKVARRRQASA